jgi:hypothetical protein
VEISVSKSIVTTLIGQALTQVIKEQNSAKHIVVKRYASQGSFWVNCKYTDKILWCWYDINEIPLAVLSDTINKQMYKLESKLVNHMKSEEVVLVQKLEMLK